MPFYEYECQHCKFYTEVMQKITDAPLKKCPSCGKESLKKLVSAPVFRLKGSGWYETDFKSEKESKRNLASEREEAKPAAEESKSETKAPEAKESPAQSAVPEPAAPASVSAVAPKRRIAAARKAPAAAKVSARTAASRSKAKAGRAKSRRRR